MKIEASSVSETTKRDAGVLESCVQRKFTPAPLWTEAILAALQQGVQGGKRHGLIDKVWHPERWRRLFGHGYKWISDRATT